MSRVLTGIFLSALLYGFSSAQGAPPTKATVPPTQQSTNQSAEPGSNQAGGTLRIAPGGVIPAQLTRSIDAKKAKTGDQVEAKVTHDLKANGQVVVPKDTKVVGHVTVAQARSKEQKESQIGIAFDHVVLKNGVDAPMPMSIQAIIAPSTLNDNTDYAGGESGGQPASPSYSGMSGGGGRSAAMGGGGMRPQTPSSAPAGGEEPTSLPDGANAHRPISESTQGVVGISSLKLSAAADMTQGSVLSSEKGNVKLESGTLILLRVNQ